METFSAGLSTSPPSLNYPNIQTFTSKPILRIPSSTSQSRHFMQTVSPPTKAPRQAPQTEFPNSQLTKTLTTLCNGDMLRFHLDAMLLKSHVSFLSMGFFFPLSCFASEAAVPTTQEVSNKINLEAVVVSVDDFFNKNPFFVAGVVFIWLVVVPLGQEYFRKYKFISAIDAFRKLRDDPNYQLLDIRDEKSLDFLNSPNLKILNKSVLQVAFSEGDEEGFLRQVLEKFKEPDKTTVCVLDNFDGNSMKVAELLAKNGLKEAYAIRGGIRGNKGWQEIQETLLPPSVHIYPKKKAKVSQQPSGNGGVNSQTEGSSSSVTGLFANEPEKISDGSVISSSELTSGTKCGPRSSSPYPNYPDLKPPSSPTPSKPEI
ncbi:uncharacterized protein [Coffea arabica]|uniref:Uncharacterized protein isoform X2 n=1 Tax=Coffea arabica TaxID=13443 RepID=A0A6P6UNV3_COFAR|nr:rhodanese-like domain-containing protein 4A, chloroplastic isoform X2 [Coffea arabica]